MSAMVHQTPTTAIQGWLDEGRAFQFIDVRTEGEWRLAHVDAAKLLTQDGVEVLQNLPKDTPLAFLCHHGIRSDAAAQHFARLGFTEVHNIIGGIEAWSTEVDPDIPRY